ncbi:hypothetical protein ACN6AT_37405 (plasmid) [Streptomyces sp. JL4002]
MFHNRILKVDKSSNVVSTVAGNGGSDGTQKGYGARSQIWQPVAVSVAPNGDVYFTAGQELLKRDAISGEVRAVRGTAGLTSGAIVASDAGVYVADRSMKTVILVKPDTGELSVVAGDGGEASKIGATAKSTSIGPMDISLDSSGNLYISDEWSRRILKVTCSTGAV